MADTNPEAGYAEKSYHIFHNGWAAGVWLWIGEQEPTHAFTIGDIAQELKISYSHASTPVKRLARLPGLFIEPMPVASANSRGKAYHRTKDDMWASLTVACREVLFGPFPDPPPTIPMAGALALDGVFAV